MNILFPIAAVFIWASNAVVSKMATEVIEPGSIAFYRWFIALIILTPFCLRLVIRHREKVRKNLTKLTTLAALGMVLNQCLAYYAAHTTSATNITVFLSLMPLIGLFLAVPLLGNKLKIQALLGACISFTGLVYMLSEGNPASLLSNGIKQGDFLMIFSSLAYALYSVLLNRWKLDLNPWVSVYCQVFIGAVLQLPLLLISDSYTISSEAWPMVLFAAVFASVLAPWCWLKAVQKLGAGTATLFMNLMPIFAVIISLFLLGEKPSTFHLVGGGMVMCGLLLAQSKFLDNRESATPKAA